MQLAFLCTWNILFEHSLFGSIEQDKVNSLNGSLWNLEWVGHKLILFSHIVHVFKPSCSSRILNWSSCGSLIILNKILALTSQFRLAEISRNLSTNTVFALGFHWSGYPSKYPVLKMRLEALLMTRWWNFNSWLTSFVLYLPRFYKLFATFDLYLNDAFQS